MNVMKVLGRRATAVRCVVLGTALHFALAVPSYADVFANVGEAKAHRLVYTLHIQDAANYAAYPVLYAVDNHLAIAGPVDRIAYYLELVSPAGQLQYVYASVDAFTQDLGQIGIPTAANGAYFQRNVRNMNVASNVPGIVTGDWLAGGNIEFWRSNYKAALLPDGVHPNQTGYALMAESWFNAILALP